MPHCDTCARFYNPNTLRPDGSCPTCGQALADPPAEAAEPAGAPWHFKLIVALTVLYLGYRLLELVAWLLRSL